MPEEDQKQNTRKDDIIETALSLFSEKGYENTRVEEIAKSAGVNQALIYYYFKSKEAILDYLLEKFYDGITRICMDFISNNIIKRIHNGTLDILPDRFRFKDKGSLEEFLNSMPGYLGYLFDYVFENRGTVRLMLAESLKRQSQQRGLFRFFESSMQIENNPLYQSIKDEDSDFSYSSDAMIHGFFYYVVPLLSMAAYFDDYLTYSSVSREELRSNFLRVCLEHNPCKMDGGDLFITLSDAPTAP